MFYLRESCHGNAMTPLRFLLTFVFLGTRILFSERELLFFRKGACTSLSYLGYGKV